MSHLFVGRSAEGASAVSSTTPSETVVSGFHPSSSPGGLPMPKDFEFDPEQRSNMGAYIQAALPSGRLLVLLFSIPVFLVFSVSLGVILTTGSDRMPVLFAAAALLAGIAGGWTGWTYVNAWIGWTVRDILDVGLGEIPALYETMRQAKQEKGVHAPLWLSHALNGVITQVVWPSARRNLRETMGLLRWLPLRPARRAFYRCARYASDAIRNEHARQQHLQSVFVTVSAGFAHDRSAHDRSAHDRSTRHPGTYDQGASRNGSRENESRENESRENGGRGSAGNVQSLHETEAGSGAAGGDSPGFGAPTTPESVRQAIDACIDDVRANARKEARRIWWKMTLWGFAGYAAAAVVLAAMWMLGL